MSNIVLQPNSSGTGSITIATPNTNTDRTLNIPDVAGNLVTTGDTGTVTGTMIGSLPTGSIVQVVHYHANEQTLAQGTVTAIYNTQITPSAIGNKIFFMVTIPSITISATNRRITCDGYIGTSATPASNTKLITLNAMGGIGSGADNTVTSTMISGEFTTTSTSVHYASLTITTPSNASCTIARHSAISRIIVWEKSS